MSPPGERRPLRVYLGAFGDPGHAFPMLALGEALVARGHAVALQTWRRWQEPAEAAGIEFAAAPEYQVFPTRERPLAPYQAAVHAARETVPSVEAFAPDIAVSDILTPAPALAAELCGVPVATLVPHVHPWSAPGFPPYSLGARLPRTPRGRLALAALRPASSRKGSSRAGASTTTAARGSGWRRCPGSTPGSRARSRSSGRCRSSSTRAAGSRGCASSGRCCGSRPASASRRRPATARSCSWRRRPRRIPSTACCARRWPGSRGAPVRVIATYNGREPDPPVAVPANAVLVPWLSYARSMPAADVVVTHGGHGTLVRALSCGCALVVCPAGGDMAENAARADWAGLGVRLPRRLLGPRTLRLAVQRALGDARMRARARAAAAWIAAHDGARAAARELEAWAAAARRR